MGGVLYLMNKLWGGRCEHLKHAPECNTTRGIYLVLKMNEVESVKQPLIFECVVQTSETLCGQPQKRTYASILCFFCFCSF